MTNFSHSSALRCATVLALATLVGCGPKDGAKEYEQGKAAYEVQDLKKADRLLEKSVERAPSNVDRLLLLARTKLALGDLNAANDRQAKAAALAPNDWDVVLLGAQIAWHLRDYARAVEGFASIAENRKLGDDVRSEGLTGIGIVEMTRNNVHLARVAFLKALRLDRKNAAAWYHLGLLYRDGFGYAEAALEQFEIFVRLDANSSSPRVQKVQRTVIPDLKGDIARNAASRPGAARRDSSASATLISKAEAAWKKGSFKNARQFYQDALKADPLSSPAAMGLAKAWLKTDATKAGKDKALESYRLACSLRPGSVSTYLTAGGLAASLGYHAQAVEIYSRAVAASPTSFEALDGLIRSLRRVGSKTDIAKAYQGYRDSLPQRGKRK